jgi:branched-chain amino acid aminotransferase
MSLAWWNGSLVEPAEIRLDPGDAGFLFGDGLFETLRCDDGTIRDAAAHLDRLELGLRQLKIELSEGRKDLEEALVAVARGAPRPTARLRLTVTRGAAGGPSRLITAEEAQLPGEEDYARGVAVRLLPQYRIDSASPLAGLKSTSYQAHRLALAHARSQGAWEALLVNEAGLLAEGSRSNVVLVLRDGAFTPPVASGCLPGTVRRRLLEAGAVAERPFAQEDLAAAQEILLLNSLIGVLPVCRVNSTEVPLGPRAARLRRLWEELTGPGGLETSVVRPA